MGSQVKVYVCNEMAEGFRQESSPSSSYPTTPPRSGSGRLREQQEQGDLKPDKLTQVVGLGGLIVL